MRTASKTRYLWSVALVVAFLAVLGIWSIRDNDSVQSATTAGGPATVEHIEGTEFSKITLTDQAVQRIDIQIATVAEAEISGATRLTVPYGAIFYDSMGNGWVYTNPEGFSYLRAPVTIERVEGDTAILTAGPDIGAKVVSQGAALLYGTEFGVGH